MEMKITAEYKTKQREKILLCLQHNRGNNLSVDKLLEKLTEEGSVVGKTTIYRYLDKLVASGQVQKYTDAETHVSSYEISSGNCHSHLHLKCIKCGNVIHLDCDHIDSFKSHIMETHKFKINNIKTVLYGECEKCKN